VYLSFDEQKDVEGCVQSDDDVHVDRRFRPFLDG
jgi:hypothetical protein